MTELIFGPKSTGRKVGDFGIWLRVCENELTISLNSKAVIFSVSEARLICSGKSMAL